MEINPVSGSYVHWFKIKRDVKIIDKSPILYNGNCLIFLQNSANN